MPQITRTDRPIYSSALRVIVWHSLFDNRNIPDLRQGHLQEVDSVLFVVGCQDAESPGRRLLELDREATAEAVGAAKEVGVEAGNDLEDPGDLAEEADEASQGAGADMLAKLGFI